MSSSCQQFQVADLRVDTRLEHRPFDPGLELALFLKQLDDAGGVVSFVGVARPRSKEGVGVDRLFLEHHPRLTKLSLDRIAEETARKFQIPAVRVVHRCGHVMAGEPIVFVATADLHRRRAFCAADYLMDHLKTEAIFWKREEGVNGSAWIEPSASDYRDRDRWSEACPESTKS